MDKSKIFKNEPVLTDILEELDVYLSEEQIAELEANTESLTFKKGETIAKEGMFVDHIYYVKNGLVKQTIGHSADILTTIKIVPPGQFIELPQITILENYPFGLIALKKSTIGVVPKEFLTSFMEENQGFFKFLLKQFDHDYYFMFKKLSMLHTKQTYGKVAEVLLQLSQQKYLAEDIFSHITKRDIADLAGTSLESVTRTTKMLRQKGIISLEGTHYVIKDYDGLKEISTTG